jgi:hypothetical protein
VVPFLEIEKKTENIVKRQEIHGPLVTPTHSRAMRPQAENREIVLQEVSLAMYTLFTLQFIGEVNKLLGTEFIVRQAIPKQLLDERSLASLYDALPNAERLFTELIINKVLQFDIF